MKKLLLAALLVACGGDLDPASRLVSFRTVAIRATRVVQSDTCDAGLTPAAEARPGSPAKLGKTQCDSPGSYAHPGDEVQLELLWHDPVDQPRSWAWTTCLNPTSTTVFGCFQKLALDLGKLAPEQRLSAIHFRADPVTSKTFEGNELAADPKSDPRTLFRVKIPSDALSQLASASPNARKAATLGVVFIACPGRLKPNSDTSARNSLPIVCRDSKTGEELGSDKFTIGIRRVFLREKDENQDPRITAVKLNGALWPEGESRDIKAICNGDEARFDRCDGDGQEISLDLAQPFSEKGGDEFGETYNEQVVIQYYVTEGLFQYDVKRAEDPKTRFAGRRGKLGPQTMWIVIRDNRGGVSWVKRSFNVIQ